MKKIYLLTLLMISLISCSDSDSLSPNPFVAAFQEQSTNYAKVQGSRAIEIDFSETAENSGYIVVSVENSLAEYGVDYTTSPETENGTITLPFSAGDDAVSFEFNNLLTNYDEESQEKEVKFTITEINMPGDVSIQGYDTHLVSFSVIIGGTVEPQIGGPNEPYQVYFDLSTGESKSVQRDSWDLGFYSGDDFRVILNGSIYMATKNLEVTDIDAITESDIDSDDFTQVAIGTFDPDNEEYIDAPSGDITQTAMQEIVVEATDNKVYLLNMGYEVGTQATNNGSVAVAGDHRGWKKIRVLRQDDGYLLQYAGLNDTTHEEIFIPKTPEYNFNNFSFNTNSIVQVQPEKEEWDLCFTVFTNVIAGAGSYGFSDFITNNILADAKAFMVMETSSATYDSYTFNEEEATALLSDDQRAIGSNWREVINSDKYVYDDRFFVLKDTEGNWYKIKFLALLNETGERGHPKFEYELLK